MGSVMFWSGRNAYCIGEKMGLFFSSSNTLFEMQCVSILRLLSSMVSGLALSDVHGLLEFLGMGSMVPCFIASGMSPLVYILFSMSRKMVWNESGAFFSIGGSVSRWGLGLRAFSVVCTFVVGRPL